MSNLRRFVHARATLGLAILVSLLPHSRGQSLQFSSVFGGSGSPISNGLFTKSTNLDVPQKISVDDQGNIYVAGTSFSTDFPLVHPLPGSAASTVQAGVPFVAKFDPSGLVLLYSTFIGPPQTAAPVTSAQAIIPIALTIDPSGNVYVTGATTGTGFPAPSGQQVPVSAGLTDVFVIKLDPNGNLLSSMVLGGSGNDQGTAIALDSSGYVYLTGTTTSPNLPVSPDAFHSSPSSPQDVFLVKLDSALSKVVYGTYLGPGTGPLLSIASGDVYIAASTSSSNWPVTAGSVPSICGPNCSAIVALRFNIAASKLVFARYLSGGATDTVSGIALGSDGSLYLTGSTSSINFPVSDGALQPRNLCTGSLCTNAFVTRLKADGSAIVFSTYLGGSGSDVSRSLIVDSAGNATIAGLTTSSDLPTLNAIQVKLFPIICVSFNGTGEFGQSSFCNAPSGFFSRINPAGTALLSSSFVGGVVTSENVFNGLNPYLGAFDLASDSSGNLYVAGVGIGLDGSRITPSGSATIVKIAPQGKPILLSQNSITDSSLFQPGLPQAGGLATAFVTGLDGVTGTLTANGIPVQLVLGGVSVKVNGEAAPILAVAAQPGGFQQINFQVPFNQVTPTNQAFRVEINYYGNSTFTGAAPLPANLIEYPNTGGTGAVLHGADSSPVTSSNPIVPGEIIVMYGTGFGQVTPVATTGVPFEGPASANVGSVYLGGQNCPILYAGTSPGSIGLYQVNCQTASRAPTSTPIKSEIYLQQVNNFLATPAAVALWNSNGVVVWTR